VELLTLTILATAIPPALLGLAGGAWLSKRNAAKRAVLASDQAVDSALARFAEAERFLDAGHCRFAFSGGPTEWSPGMFRLAGLESRERPLNFHEFLATVYAEDDGPVRQAMYEAAEKGRGFVRDFRIVRPDGTVRRVHAAVRPEADENGKVESIDCFFRDISGDSPEAATMSTALAAANSALTEAQLESRAKSDFLALMSHELRTPLNAVQGFAVIIENEMYGPLSSPHYAECVHNIREGGDHLLAIVNDILDLSKVEAGQMEINAEPVDLADVIESTAALLGERADSLGIILKTSLPDELAPLNADGRMVKQMLINLISNALDHTPPDGWVGVTAELDADGGCTLAVADTGEGIAPEDLSRAVLPFQAISGPMNKPGLGTGLGLPLVKSLIELHGGDFFLKSTPAVGTTVTLRFPPNRVMGMGGEKFTGQGDP